tara:strand:- start:683 stop:1402 length:720 start_codon:yes stop_codon:yes gene_type:complete
VLDTKPRKLTDLQRNALRTLSRQVIIQLELRKRLNEEASLRSEIDHRVRNSLQTIASIIKVSARGITDAKAKEVLSLVERRLSAVASLHSELMGSDGAGVVAADAYLLRVGSLLADIAPPNVSVFVKADEHLLDARQASAIGMIASEFTANSIKHAFPDDQIGNVDISLKRGSNLTWTLTCQDNGVGDQSDDARDFSRTGLGEMLMESAALQLGGLLTPLTTEAGTAVKVEFKAQLSTE